MEEKNTQGHVYIFYTINLLEDWENDDANDKAEDRNDTADACHVHQNIPIQLGQTPTER